MSKSLMAVFVAILALIGGLILHSLTQPKYTISNDLSVQGEGVPIKHSVFVEEDSWLELTVTFTANYYLKAGGGKAFIDTLVNISRADGKKIDYNCESNISEEIESPVDADKPKDLTATQTCDGDLPIGTYDFTIKGITPGNCYYDSDNKRRCLMTLQANYTIEGI